MIVTNSVKDEAPVSTKTSAPKEVLTILAVSDAKTGGGAELVFDRTTALLQQRGHGVEYYYAKEQPQFDQRDLAGYLYSRRHCKALEERLLRLRPNIVHLHNFYKYLSPAILITLQRLKPRLGFKVVMTVHDYHFVCANNSLMRWRDSLPEACDACAGRKYHHILRRQCDNRGRLANVMKFLQHAIHYNLFHSDSAIDLFIAPSGFMAEKIQQFAPTAQVEVIHNPAFDVEARLEDIRQRALTTPTSESVYIGRVTPEKGLLKFLQADYSPERFGNLSVLGAGDDEHLKEVGREVQLRGWDKRVRFYGFQPHDIALTYLYNAKRLIFPSLCPENNPLVCLEARYLGKDIFHYGQQSVQEILSLEADQITESYYLARLERALVADAPRLRRSDRVE